ncbi:MAG TPA: HAD family phosphatase [Sedimentisphaerales bacterium]|nr:HAD family phosphatase [Sedimentisphaerales bacterium]
MLRAVIFDFDGVITDSEVLHLRAFNRMLGRFAIEISKEDYYRDYLGLTDLDLLAVLAEKGLLKVGPQDIERLAKQKEEIFHRLVETGGTIIGGVRPFLRMLSENHVPIAICSGALLAEIELILDKEGLRKFFEVIVSAEQVKKGKPHPDGFVLTLEKLNQTRHDSPISTGQCVVIEDSHWGLDAAKAAGMHTVAITNSYDAEQLSMAEKVVNHLDELDLPDLEKLCA